MLNPSVLRIMRKVLVLALMCAGLLLLPHTARKAAACDTCWNESREVYIYCSQNPDGYFNGCEFNAYCSDMDWQLGATHLYTETCCGVGEQDSHWFYYCL